MWIFGQVGSGKKEVAEALYYYQHTILGKDTILLHHKEFKSLFKNHKELDVAIANLAKLLNQQKKTVIVYSVLPTRKIRKKVSDITNCKFVYIDAWVNGLDLKEYPFWRPDIL